MARKIVLTLGIVLLIIGGVVWWRATHPPLTDQEQIVANLESVRTSAESASVSGVVNHLAEDFSWNGNSRSQVQSLLTGGFYQGLRKRDIRLSFSNLRPQVNGATATVSGRFMLAVSGFRGSADTYSGEFSTEWEKRDGQWKIKRATGGQDISGAG